MKTSINTIKEKMGLNSLIQWNEVELNDEDYYKIEGEPFNLYTKAQIKAKGVPCKKIIKRVDKREVR